MSGTNKLKFGNLTLDAFYDAAHKAVAANLPAGTKLKILGKKLGKKQVLNELAARKKRYEDVEKARTRLSELVAEREKAEPEAQSFADGYAAAIKAEFGTSPTIDEKYGVPRKQPRRQRSAQEKVQASAKAAATRDLRHTMGPRQKELVKATGDFTVTVSTSSPDPSHAAQAGAPVASAPVAGSPHAVTPAPPAPVGSGSATASNGVASSGPPVPKLMNGADHQAPDPATHARASPLEWRGLRVF